ncbi:MAG: STAS-like domain-containing protein [Sulfuricella sp.]|nr:STAS-like domain-containing protein [Sulfuricella sp.]
MGNKVINIERDFSRYPAGRYVADGPYNGEKFREEFLVPALLEKTDKVLIELDGARGLGSSFLDEAFGGLVRSGYSAEDVLNRIELRSQDASLIEEIKGYIQEQAKISKQH